MKRVIVLGSYNLGLTIASNALPVWGETMLGGSSFFSHGGKGANQAVAARRFGATVEFVGCVGTDASGQAARELLEQEGIGIQGLRQATDAPTGVAAIFLDDDGSNAIVVAPGANARLSEADVERARSGWQAADVLLAQLEVPLASVRDAFERHPGLRILNPAPAPPPGQICGDWVDILTPNETEAKILVGLDPATEIAPAILLQRLRDTTGILRIVMTLGAAGALIADHTEVWHQTAPLLEAVDTTGAGDVFNGIMAAGLSEGQPLRQAVAWAVRGASLSVLQPGVIPAIPQRSAILGAKEPA
ncbi:MAG: ribokinase [Thermaerobacter sp.]|nr:ribokinase [Thermaerobacter sp.]